MRIGTYSKWRVTYSVRIGTYSKWRVTYILSGDCYILCVLFLIKLNN